MIAALLLAASFAAPARAATVKLFAFDEKGAPLSVPGLLARLARADDKKPDADRAAFWAFPIDEKSPPARVKLAQLVSANCGFAAGVAVMVKLAGLALMAIDIV